MGDREIMAEIHAKEAERRRLASMTPAERAQYELQQESERVGKLYAERRAKRQAEEAERQRALEERTMAPIRAAQAEEVARAKGAARAEWERAGGDTAKFEDHWQQLIHEGRAMEPMQRVRARAWQPRL